MTEDNELKKYENFNKQELSKIDLEAFYDLDTIKTNILKQNIPVKNIGEKVIKNIYIKTTCDCTTTNNYKKVLQPNETDTLKIVINISKEKGYFSKKVIVYGTFYPYKRVIEIIGYRK
ncbi:DUF1573 domain-containing protein [Bergeyella sp. RCAD1439]|uniref:DUF1573 domain-containing protein n=1 Tax=Bergeyella anatis TaxID=3113737 RepID=UPI002E184244|nr:DUF1573 domain-containing protein [Bergeyella sp. RCAD1439]